jgi:hypothetical protein
VLSDLRERWLGDVFELELALLDLPIAELVDHFQDFRPRREHPAVDLFVGLDRHAKLELFGGHFAFLGAAAIVGAAPAGTTTTLEPRGAGDSTLIPAAPLITFVARCLSGNLPPLKTTAAVDDAFTPILPARITLIGAGADARWLGTALTLRFGSGWGI